MSRSWHEEITEVALGCAPQLYNAAYRLTRNEAEAEDLVQNAYAEAFQAAHQLRSLAACKVWLFRILRNRFLSDRRRAAARPQLVVLDGGVEAAAEEQQQHVLQRMGEVERAAVARHVGKAIRGALEKLPEEMSTAVLLCDADGFRYEQIAEIMECPIGTVRSRIARGRALLVRELASHAQRLGIGKGRAS